MESINQNKFSSSSAVINIESIYESASEIGEHFKKLIELFGSETFEKLIPCVVKVLENFEDIEELQKEHQKRMEEQLKYQSEIEDIDELWRKENNKLEQYIRYLKKENNRLNLLKSTDKISHSLNDLIPEENENERNYETPSPNSQLVDAQNDKLRTKLRILNNEIDNKNEEIETLKNEKDNLIKENKNLRNIVSFSLNTILDTSLENNEDCSKVNHNELKDKIKILEDKLQYFKSKLHDTSQEIVDSGVAVEAELINDAQKTSEEIIKTEDLPVQGPIPKEPDEKLYWPNYQRQSKSRIWSFFPRLTKALIR